jgi:hypothetical protein
MVDLSVSYNSVILLKGKLVSTIKKYAPYT